MFDLSGGVDVFIMPINFMNDKNRINGEHKKRNLIIVEMKKSDRK